MQFLILVKQNPYQTQAADTAINFVRAALTQGHSIRGVFFYQNGVLNGSRLLAFSADERDPAKCWSTLRREHGIELYLCIGSCHKRGIMDDREKQRFGKDSDNISKDFDIVGLGQFVKAGIDADRVVSFG